jgi:hypothetical protein
MASPLIIGVTIINPRRRNTTLMSSLLNWWTGISWGRERFRARKSKRLRSPGIDSEESIPPGYKAGGIDSWAYETFKEPRN